jgi:isoquinoline 1-oxidoreductase alpha subunit
MLELIVNGRTHQVDVEPEMPLLWVLRDHLGLSGTKYGCGVAQCGACTVLIDGEPVLSCMMPVSSAAGRPIVTIEGLARDGVHRVQKAWIDHEVPQCGYCQSGMILTVVAFLDKHPRPTDAEIDAGINALCRCGTYPRVRAAIRALAREEVKGGRP